jgi:hypothetical protein
MTTRILSPRAVRVAVASLLVLELLYVWPAPAMRPLIGLSLVALAWFIVPGDRRWFIPATVLATLAVAIWPTTLVVYDLPNHSKIIVHRITGRVELTGQAPDPVPLTPHPTPLGYFLEGLHATRTPAADTVMAAVPAPREDRIIQAPQIRSTMPVYPGDPTAR